MCEIGARRAPRSGAERQFGRAIGCDSQRDRGRCLQSAFVSAVMARLREHHAVNEDNDEHGNRHDNQGLHTVEGRAAGRAFAEGQERSC
jgi:hypothetical protein